MKEKWKPWTETYLVSNKGRVMNSSTGKILKGSIMNIATYVKIIVKGKRKEMSVNKAMRELWQK